MIGIIFIVICAGLLVKGHAGELFLMASEAWPDAVLLSTGHWAPGTKHCPFTCTQQKFGKYFQGKLLCELKHEACRGTSVPIPLNKAFSLAQWNGSLSTPKVYLLNHERCKFYIQDLPFTPAKTQQNQQGVVYLLTPPG